MAASTLPVRPDYSLKSVDKSELPRERVRKLGVGALKNEELIAIILRTGSHGENVLHLAERLLRENSRSVCGLRGAACRHGHAGAR